MSLAEIEKIKAAENSAEILKKQTDSEVQQMLQKARREASELIEKAEKEAEEAYKNTLKQAEEQAEDSYRQIIKSESENCSMLQDSGRKKKQSAVDYIVRRVVGTYGNS